MWEGNQGVRRSPWGFCEQAAGESEGKKMGSGFKTKGFKPGLKIRVHTRIRVSKRGFKTGLGFRILG